MMIIKFRISVPKVFVDSSTKRLIRAVGKSKSMEMILTGDAISAEEAKECGLISKLVKHEELIDEAHATASVIAANSKLTAQMCKEWIFENLDGS